MKKNNSFIDFVPKSLYLRDSDTIPPKQLDNLAKSIYGSVSIIAAGSIPIDQIIKFGHTDTVTIDNLNITREENNKPALKTKNQKYIKLF